jgi:hypothetical protein
MHLKFLHSVPKTLKQYFIQKPFVQQLLYPVLSLTKNLYALGKYFMQLHIFFFSHVVVENKPAEDLKAPSNLYVLSS